LSKLQMLSGRHVLEVEFLHDVVSSLRPLWSSGGFIDAVLTER